jgi:hypothetical protein
MRREDQAWLSGQPRALRAKRQSMNTSGW